MRLLLHSDTGEFSLTKDLIGDDTIPPYAILSHTWGADADEVTFEDLTNGTGKDKPGYEKIRFCGEQARQDDLQYFWIDTCCINKANYTELTQAINSMFRWYRDATRCYVYLPDVLSPAFDINEDFNPQPWKSDFRKSRWFERGWTLQELLAPSSVEFFSRERQRFGNKISLKQQIHEITGIANSALQGTPLSQFSVDERLSWIERRQTKLEEDKSYSMLGIFDVSMPLIYGEGKEKAFKRLWEEIGKRSKDFPTRLPSPRATRNTTAPVVHRPFPSRRRFCRAWSTARSDPAKVCCARVLDCARRPRWCRVRTYKNGMATADSEAESPNLPSNMPTDSEGDRLKRGFSGSTQAMRPVSSRAIGILQIQSRSLGGGVRGPTYSSSYTTGCATVGRESGFSSWTMSTMLVSFSKINLSRRASLVIQAQFPNHRESISLKARMARSL